jgi:HAD superfamily hydrolase (TIGR01509 family)
MPSSAISPKESIFKMLEKTRVYIKNSGKADEEYDNIRENALFIARKYELKAARTTSILPGVLETIKELKRRNLQLAVFTINSKDTANYILNKLNLLRFFNKVISREDVPAVKPDPIHLELTLKALGANPDETIVVGDNVVDIKSAKSLSVKAIGIASNQIASEQLRIAGATDVIKNIAELNSLITKL